jgi:aspartyl/asparaginyl-tRNA synthetase
MPRTLIRDLAEHAGEQVTVHGWINTLRLQRKIQFVLIRDHTGVVQVTNKRSEPASEVEAILQHGAPVESAVTVVGTVVDNPSVKLGGVELIPTTVEVVNRAEPSLPIRQDSGSITAWTGDSSICATPPAI